MNDIAGLMDPMRAVKNQKIIISDSKSHFREIRLGIHEQFFKKLMHEIIINAMKYSAGDSSITMLFDTQDDNLVISVMNTPEKAGDGVQGIPAEYENIVFEPFFRIIENHPGGVPDPGLRPGTHPGGEDREEPRGEDIDPQRR